MLSDQPKQLENGAVTGELSFVNVPTDHRLELWVDLDWRTLKHELPSEVQQAQVGALIQKNGEVSLTKLDVDQQKNMRDAMTREIQSWLKNHSSPQKMS